MSDVGDLFALPPATVYKSDRRSRVWRVDPPDGPSVVIKRFVHAPLRQLVARLLHVHPAQRERAIGRQMRKQGLSVPPITAFGWTRRGLGGEAWLISEWQGPSLVRLMEDRLLTPAQRKQAAVALGRLVADLLRAGWFFRDLKTSNILLDDDGKLWLIDVGSARRDPGGRRWARMLAILDETACRDGASRVERLRFVKALVERRPELGDVRAAVARAVMR